VPPDLADLADPELASLVVQPALSPGDLLVFSEPTLHGTLPWAAEHQRRTCIYRFAPAGSAYGRGRGCSMRFVVVLSSRPSLSCILCGCVTDTRWHAAMPPWRDRRLPPFVARGSTGWHERGAAGCYVTAIPPTHESSIRGPGRPSCQRQGTRGFQGGV
jgi:hypothetical protein